MKNLARSLSKGVAALAFICSLVIGGYVGIHSGFRIGVLVGLFVFASIGGFDMLWTISKARAHEEAQDRVSLAEREEHIERTKDNPTIR